MTTNDPECASDRAVKEPDGSELIAAERARQISVEGWDAFNDKEYECAELICAALCYAAEGSGFSLDGFYHKNPADPPALWPFEARWWKPGDNSDASRLRNLVKAGALIAAEIDRLKAGGA